MRRSGLFALFALSTLMLGILTLINIPTVKAERGSDWNAEFYNCKNLDCDKEYDIDYEDGINFDWGDGKPEDDDGDELEDMRDDDFSVRFETDEDFDSGEYEFVVTANDGVRVYINGDLVLDEWDDRDDDETFEFTYNVGSDQELSLRVDYYEKEDDAIIQFEWHRQGEATSDDTGGGAAATAGPSPTPIPPAQASVVRVNGLAIRTGPYLGATLVGVARPGTVYDVLAKNDSEGVYTWYLLTSTSGITGWSSGRYLELTVDPSGIPSEGSVFDSIDGQPDRGVIGIPRAVMNFRVRPSTRTGVISQIGWGEQVQIIGRTIRGGENYWLHVRRSDGTVGWIYAPFVTIQGNPIDAVPIH